MTSAGRFIVFEGGDGAGKSTVLRAVADRLRDEGRDVISTREPGGTQLGERVRELVLAQQSLDDALAELLLFEAARAHLIAAVIRPALERGAVVLCDRFVASSIAYQGAGRGLGRDVVERANAIATGGLAPDLTLLLDLPVETGLGRRTSDGAINHFDRETIAFHQRVRDAYLDLARESPQSWRIIDATLDPAGVITAASAALSEPSTL